MTSDDRLHNREWAVTEAEADDLRALLAAKPGDPGTLNCEPTPIPLGEVGAAGHGAGDAVPPGGAEP